MIDSIRAWPVPCALVNLLLCAFTILYFFCILFLLLMCMWCKIQCLISH